MPNTYLQDMEKIIDTLCRDERLILEAKLILLGLMMDHLTEVTGNLEEEQAMSERGLIH